MSTNLGAEAQVGGNRLVHGLPDVRVEALDEVLPGEADLQPLDLAGEAFA